MMEKVKFIEEKPVYILKWKNYEEGEKNLKIYINDLLDAKIGTTFYIPDEHHCWRGVIDDELTVVYKDINGIGCVARRYNTSDEVEPDYLPDVVEFVYFKVHKKSIFG